MPEKLRLLGNKYLLPALIFLSAVTIKKPELSLGRRQFIGTANMWPSLKKTTGYAFVTSLPTMKVLSTRSPRIGKSAILGSVPENT